MQRLCNKCEIWKETTEFYVTNKKTGRMERCCKSCRMGARRTPERREYIRKWRANKKLVGHYGRCTICDSSLGRNDHKGRVKLNKCQSCITMDNHWNWNGGKTITADGYVKLRYAPLKTMLEHRYVMEQHLGRKLCDDETIHHLNGDRQDNRLENLELWVGAPVRGIRVPDAIAWAKEVLERYDQC